MSDTLVGQIITGEFDHPIGSRSWRLYVPSQAARDARVAREIRAARVAAAAVTTPGAHPMLVVLHGCTQTAADLALGTRLEAAAEAAGWLVLFPEQPASAHPQRCWNWYSPAHQVREGGEPELLTALIAHVAGAHGGDSTRVHVAGLSAGGAMAVSLAATWPERVQSVAVMSGVPYRAAATVPDALAAMRDGPREGRATADDVLAAMGERARAIPLLVVHGAKDVVVHRSNAERLVQQWQAVLERTLGTTLVRDGSDASRDSTTTVTRWRTPAGIDMLEVWTIGSLGHAWSGGDPAGTYTDPAGPDVSAALFRFVQSHDRDVVPDSPSR